jgi:hypothetical protein
MELGLLYMVSVVRWIRSCWNKRRKLGAYRDETVGPRLERLETRLFLSADPLGMGGSCPVIDASMGQAELVVSLIPGNGDSDAGVNDAELREERVAGIPEYNSELGAAHTLYLDFDGHSQGNWGSFSDIEIPAFQGDVDDIMYIVQVVTDDFAPFDVNVTTVEPEAEALLSGAGWRAVIGGNGSSHGYSQGILGIAYMNDFTWGGDPNAIFVFSDNFRDMREIGNTVSHELGHTVGLQHYWFDANDNGAYDSGENTNSGAIMGTPDYGANRETWSYGRAAENTEIAKDQDDVQILGQTLGWHADLDGGDTRENASRIPVSMDGPSEVHGVIEQLDDADHFYFDLAQSGDCTFSVDMDSIAANLDVELTLYDSLNGSAIAVVNPGDDLGATLTRNLKAGRYYLRMTSDGGLGEIGRYTLRVQAPVGASVPVEVPPQVVDLTVSVDTGSSTSDKVTNDTTPTLDIRFSKPVTGTQADVQLFDPQGAPVPLARVTGWGSQTLSVTLGQTLTQNGQYQVVLKHSITDQAGVALNGGQDYSDTFVLDTIVPAVTVSSLTTSDTSPRLSGTVSDPEARIWVTVGSQTYEAVNLGNSLWELPQGTIDPNLALGTYDVVVQATDSAGNTGRDTSIDELIIESPESPGIWPYNFTWGSFSLFTSPSSQNKNVWFWE